MDREQEIQTRERLTRLWLEAEPAVRAYVGAAVREFHDAEDVVQQVALTAAPRFDEFDASRPFLAWVLWLAKSRIVDHYTPWPAISRRRPRFSTARPAAESAGS